MRRLALLPFLFLLAACPDKKPSQESPPASTATAPPSAPSSSVAAADGGPGADAGKDSAHMAHCPAAVPGATVAIKDVEGGVEVSVTGKDDAATKEIRTRMAKLVEADKAQSAPGAVKHSGKGEGGGTFGHCAIVMKNTTIETAEIPSGSKAKVLAKDKAEVDWLRRETRDRDKDAKASGGEQAGSHRMAHCPSAVDGAKTTVKDSKEGVVVTVTGTGDQVKEIRDRAKHTAEISKLAEPPKVDHDSKGHGGGGLGKCPVIVEGETVVDAKDVENGSEITVKAKKDPAALQKEAKARAASFAAAK